MSEYVTLKNFCAIENLIQLTENFVSVNIYLKKFCYEYVF